ncbi:MurR/RpiR family transcriptional regulator [Spiroplasma culicicola]|uniref:HTH rpiR-type domain-containing protein n=1 Tax=Spiroplasma culicicola AES-1 TaxID=1276246 RepID=W6AHI9_9MOLU|nr:hypothetical protein [Spiroplasma culicicola]AHI53174.1 hypothetical protein SCULI_v1c08340 [Spiroplasma culicicola AES-1]
MLISFLKDFYETTSLSTYKVMAANLITNFQDNIFLKLKEFAQLSFVSQSTVTYFCKSLKFSGYRELIFKLKNEREHFHKNVNQVIKIDDFTFNIYRWLQNNINFIINICQEILKYKKIRIYSSYQSYMACLYFQEILRSKNILVEIVNCSYIDNFEYINKKEFKINLFIICGRDCKSLKKYFLKLFEYQYQRGQFLITTLNQVKEIDSDLFNNKLILDYEKDDSLFSIRHFAFTYLFLSIFLNF